MDTPLDILYEDNHLIAVNKTCHDIVQADRTGDVTLPDRVKAFLKRKYNKPGNVFCGVPHRLDRPTSGVVILAKTGKALSRLNDMFRHHEIRKTYWAIVQQCPPKDEDRLVDFLVRNEKLNKSFVANHDGAAEPLASSPERQAKKAVLNYRVVIHGDRYTLLEINLETGRHHQIRAQLAHIGCPIKGDLKYGARRSNPDGGISLHARRVEFIHPVSRLPLRIVAPVPDDALWLALTEHVRD